MPLLLLQGCNDDTINQVKNYVYDFDTSMSVDNALDHRSICTDTEWTSFKDERGRIIVEYQCDLAGVNGYSELTRSQTLDTLAIPLSKYQEVADEIKKKKEDDINILKLGPEIKTYMDSNNLTTVYKDYTNNYYTSILDDTGAIFHSILSDINTNEHDSGRTDDMATLNKIRTYFLSKGINTGEKESKAMIFTTGQNGGYESMIELYSNNDKNGVNKAYANVKNIESRIQSIKNYQNAKSVKQLFQWSIVKGQPPTLVNSSFDVEFDNGKHQQYQFKDYINDYTILKMAYANSESTYTDLALRSKVPVWPFGQ